MVKMKNIIALLFLVAAFFAIGTAENNLININLGTALAILFLIAFYKLAKN